MSKRELQILQQAIRYSRPTSQRTGGPNDNHLDSRMTQWELTVTAIARAFSKEHPESFDHDAFCEACEK